MHRLARYALRLLYALMVVVLAEATASAQIFEIGRSSETAAVFAGIAHDPVHDVYFVVSGTHDPVGGRFINRAGDALGARIALDTQRGFNVCRVAYSADVSDGVGGFGGFVVIWTNLNSHSVVAQIVSYPGRLVGPRVPIFTTPPEAVRITKADIAYSPTDRVFLVVLGLLKPTTAFGRPWNGPSTLVRLNLDAQPIGETALSSDPNVNCPNLEFTEECNEVGVVWNPISREFAAVYNEGPEKTLARIQGDSTIVSRTTLGIGERFGAVAVNAHSGNYLIVGGSGLRTTDGAELDAAGNLVSRGFITSSLATGSGLWGFMGLSYSPASRTFLLVGLLLPNSGRLGQVILELSQHGVASPTTLTTMSYPSVLASHPMAPEWVYVPEGQGVTTIVGTATRLGGSAARLGGCTTSDPFVAVGGGTCLNAGWTPRLRIAREPVPPGGCAPPDPFAVLGGGTCVKGGWLPPGMVAPIPPPPPEGCMSPMPAADWVCVNGGWVPPGHPLARPGPSFSPCGPDPFASIGGGVCVNGGWVPRGLPLGRSGA